MCGYSGTSFQSRCQSTYELTKDQNEWCFLTSIGAKIRLEIHHIAWVGFGVWLVRAAARRILTHILESTVGRQVYVVRGFNPKCM